MITLDDIWSLNTNYLLLHYDKALEKVINLESLINRICLKDQIKIIESNVISYQTSNIVRDSHSSLNELIKLWRIQASYYDNEGTKDLLIFGSCPIGKNYRVIYGLGTRIELLTYTQKPSSTAYLKAVQASEELFSLYSTSLDFDFSSFIKKSN